MFSNKTRVEPTIVTKMVKVFALPRISIFIKTDYTVFKIVFLYIQWNINAIPDPHNAPPIISVG